MLCQVPQLYLGLGQLLVQVVDALLVTGDPVLQLRPLPDAGVGPLAGTGQLQGGLGGWGFMGDQGSWGIMGNGGSWFMWNLGLWGVMVHGGSWFMGDHES